MADTRTMIMDLSERAMQRGGYGGFSFRDIADELNIKTAAVHYHFRHKDDLGVAVARRYREKTNAFLRGLTERGLSARQQVQAFADLFAETLKDDRLCLFAATGADGNSPARMVEEARAFFDDAHKWLTAAIRQDSEAGIITPVRDAGELARETVALLYGSMLMGRNSGSPRVFVELVQGYLDKNYPKN